MKRFCFSIALLLAALFLTVRLALAHQNQPAAAPTFEKLYLFGTQDFGVHPWWWSSMAVDATGGTHATFYTTQSVFYAYCPANCNDPANWLETPIAATGDAGPLAYPSLALDTAGHPRILRFLGGVDDPYSYAECNTNCTNASNWTMLDIPTPWWSSSPDSVFYFALDPQGHPRFVADYYQGLAYVTCDSGCTTSAANWHFNQLNLGGSGLDYAQLVFNANGQPRVAGFENTSSTLDYAQCDSNCSLAANWSRITIATGAGEVLGNTTFSLRLDSQGRPRIAFYKESSEDTNIYYTWSNSNFISASDWFSATLPLPPAEARTLALAIDSQDRPRIAYASDALNMRYLECDAACETQDAEWTVYDVETGDELDSVDPIPPGADCISSYWGLDGYPSLALDANDTPYLSYHAVHKELCSGGSINTNAWGIRFATAGGTVNNANQIYLPFVIR